jgi:thiaminase/transcriptional activator TenA
MPAEGGEMAHGSLTDRLWGSIDGTFKAILDHPFIQGLTSGALERNTFRFYVVQDALYLSDYARALAICAARAPHDDAIKMFCEHAAGAIAVERQLHEGFFTDLGVADDDVSATEMAPSNLAYTSYLMSSAYGGSFGEALGAVLPCYWIYWEVGKALLSRGSPDRLYKRWIDTYGGTEFAEIVGSVLGLTNEIGDLLAAAEEEKLRRRFMTTARYEWLFWEMAYRRETWPL